MLSAIKSRTFLFVVGLCSLTFYVHVISDGPGQAKEISDLRIKDWLSSDFSSVYGKIMRKFEEEVNISQNYEFIEPEMICFAGFVFGLWGSVMLFNKKRGLQCLGVVLLQLRYLMDILDGMVYRERNNGKSSGIFNHLGFYIDAASDSAAFVLAVLAILLRLLKTRKTICVRKAFQNPPDSPHSINFLGFRVKFPGPINSEKLSARIIVTVFIQTFFCGAILSIFWSILHDSYITTIKLAGNSTAATDHIVEHFRGGWTGLILFLHSQLNHIHYLNVLFLTVLINQHWNFLRLTRVFWVVLCSLSTCFVLVDGQNLRRQVVEILNKI